MYCHARQTWRITCTSAASYASHNLRDKISAPGFYAVEVTYARCAIRSWIYNKLGLRCLPVPQKQVYSMLIPFKLCIWIWLRHGSRSCLALMTPYPDSSYSRPTSEWQEFRKRSLLPGGFGSERVNIWCVLERSFTHRQCTTNRTWRPRLLGVSTVHTRNEESPLVEKTGEESRGDEQVSQSHRDEHQIRLDTDRSFVLYPVGELLPFYVFTSVTYRIMGRHPRLTKRCYKKICMRW